MCCPWYVLEYASWSALEAVHPRRYPSLTQGEGKAAVAAMVEEVTHDCHKHWAVVDTLLVHNRINPENPLCIIRLPGVPDHTFCLLRSERRRRDEKRAFLGVVAKEVRHLVESPHSRKLDRLIE